jgi:hypothetical protein
LRTGREGIRPIRLLTRAVQCWGPAFVAIATVTLAVADLPAFGSSKLSTDERMEIERGLNSEMAIMKVQMPRSKKPLDFSSDGKYDAGAWAKATKEFGVAARVGDQIQITHVLIESDRILLEINGGLKSGRHWYDHIEAGMGTTTNPIPRDQNSNATSGSVIALTFQGGVPSIRTAEIKEMLAPLFDFDKHSATESYVEKLPEPIQKAIKEQRPVEGMDKEQILLAMGKPRSKSREMKDGDEYEDWIYGDPPGKVTFVTFAEGKVVKIHEAYANVGGSTAPPLPPQ